MIDRHSSAGVVVVRGGTEEEIGHSRHSDHFERDMMSMEGSWWLRIDCYREEVHMNWKEVDCSNSQVGVVHRRKEADQEGDCACVGP